MVAREGRIASAFARARKEGRAAFVPYVTVGDPSLAVTAEVIRCLARAGADVVECGVPFSDPVGDGVELQRSAGRALAAGTTMETTLAFLGKLTREKGIPPILLFSYLNPVLRRGYRSFARGAREAGAAGALLVDLPLEEAGAYLTAARDEAIETVFLAAPSTSDARMARIAEASRGFLYFASRAGVTGEKSRLPPDLPGQVARARKGAAGLPVGVGFGVSNAAQAAEAARFADGVIVGSAIARRVAEGGPEGAAERVYAFAESLARAVRRRETLEGGGGC